LNKPEYADVWWNNLVDRLGIIGNLRNECCHRGTQFDNKKLTALIDKVFKEKSFDDILVFGEIPVIQPNLFSATNHAAPVMNKTSIGNNIADVSLIGKNVSFKILRTGNNGNFKGIVNGQYEGSLPKTYASKMDIFKVRNTTINAVVTKIQDGKYILRT
jgi:hypothetical protein